MGKIRKRTTARMPKGWWPNTPHHRATLRLPVHLYEGLTDAVQQSDDLLNVNHAVCLAVEEFLRRRSK